MMGFIVGNLNKEVFSLISTENNIQFLRSVLNQKLEDNNYQVTSDVLKLSQLLDKFIVKYEYESEDQIVMDDCVGIE